MSDFYKKIYSGLKEGKISKSEALEIINSHKEYEINRDNKDVRTSQVKKPENKEGSKQKTNNVLLSSYSQSGIEDKNDIELNKLQRELVKSLAGVLYLAEEEIKVDTKFVDLGLDSIVGVEWVERINKIYKTNLKATKIYDYPSIRSLSCYMHKELKFSKDLPLLEGFADADTAPEDAITLPSHREVKSNSSVENNISDLKDSESLHDDLIASLAAVLFLTPNEITVDKSFIDLGLDSIVGVEWVGSINKRFKTNIKGTKIYDYPTIRKLSKYIVSSIRDCVSPTNHGEADVVLEKRLETQKDKEIKFINEPGISVRSVRDEVLNDQSAIDNQIQSLGSAVFRRRYGCRLNYFSGSMYRAISSERLVVKMGNSRILSFFGSAGLDTDTLEAHIKSIQKQVGNNHPYGMCLIHDVNDPDEELKHVNLFIEYKIPIIEAAAFFTLTPAIVYCRVKGLRQARGRIQFPRRIIAKCSRIEVAKLFLSPPPLDMINDLLSFGMITEEEARLSQMIPMADDIAVEANSGGHTDNGVSFALIPSIVGLRDQITAHHSYEEPILIGCGGGIGTPEAIASAFVLGADFVFTGSINQCTPESGAHENVKDLLALLSIHDTALAPAGDMFEIGAKVQVVSKFTQFPQRANKLYRLYQQYQSLEEIPFVERSEIENYWFKKSIEDVWDEVCAYKIENNPEQLQEAKENPKIKMKLVFQWYFAYTSRLTFEGKKEDIDNFQIHCGPAMGAFNRWAKGTIFEHWIDREVDKIADALMEGASKILALPDNSVNNNRVLPDPEIYPVTSATNTLSEEVIAVIGMAGKFPKSPDLDAFWKNIASGTDCVSIVPPSRWSIGAHYDSDKKAPGKSYCKWIGLLEDADQFDPLFFNISPAEAELMDPQQRLFLECAWHCFEDAGIDPDSLAGSSCGVYVGSVGGGEYGSGLGLGRLNAQGLMGGAPSILPARISYLLDLKGPSLSIDTACSSSLVAVAEACNSLRLGTSDLMLAGGVCVLPGPGLHIMTSKSGMLSEKGRCFAFDHRADGFVPGEGVGVVLLKPLSKAQHDGDRIHGVIKGWGTNQDGKTNGITAPSSTSQVELEASIYKKFNIDPETISLVEAHGTGTKLGDPIEVDALIETFQRFTNKKQFCALGSLKSNLGHLQSASGIAGMLKVLLAIKAKQLPPTIHFEKINPHISLDDSPFFINTSLQSWDSDKPRCASVSAFGFSGTNAHIVVEENTEKRLYKEKKCDSQQMPVLIPVSAASKKSRHQYLINLSNFFKQARSEGRTINLVDLAYTFQVGRKAMDYRVCIVAGSLQEIEMCLQSYIEEKGASGQIFFSENTTEENLKKLPQQIGSALLAWLTGEPVNWDAFYPYGGAHRIGAPLYPFDNESYWVTQVDSQKSAPLESVLISDYHPLLQEKIVDGQNNYFKTVFSGQEFFLKDHVVQNEKVLPAAAYLEMARAAVEISISRDQLKNNIIVLTNLIWIRPFYARHSFQALNLRLLAVKEGNSPFEIYSENINDSSDEKQYLHCRGNAVLADSERPRSIDVQRILQRCKKSSIEKRILYDELIQAGMAYGKAHQNVNHLFVGINEVLAEMDQPHIACDSFQPFALHPGLLDATLQAVFGLQYSVKKTQDDGNLLLPFALDRIEVYAHWTSFKWAWLRRAKNPSANDNSELFDIDVLDAHGNVCVAIRGLMCRPYKTGINIDKVSEVGLISLHPKWNYKLPRADIDATSALDRMVLFYGFDECFGQNIERDQSYRVGRLTIQKGRGSEVFVSYATDLFCRIKTLIQASRNHRVLVQVLIPSSEKDTLLQALSVMLKTARIENPNVYGQLISVSPHGSEKEIKNVLDQDSQCLVDHTIRYEAGRREVLSFEEIKNFNKIEKLCWKEGGVYLITGGLGGLGKIFASEIAQRVRQAKLILVGKSPYNASMETFISELEELGAIVDYKSVDVSDEVEVKRLIKLIEIKYGSLSGIIHSAGIIANNFIRNKSTEEFSKVLSPKVFGADHLDYFTQSTKLDFFVLFSSGSGAAGNVGQIDYAAANAFLDIFSLSRNEKVKSGARYGKTLSINWPLWAEGGMSVDNQTRGMMKDGIGMLPMTTESGIDSFYKCLNYEGSQVVVVEGDINMLRGFYQIQSPVKDKAVDSEGVEENRKKATQEYAMDTTEKTHQYLCGVLSGVAKIPVNRIDVKRPLEKYGIDSIMAMQLTSVLEEKFGPLSKTLFFEHQTLAELGEYFLQHHKRTILDIVGENIPVGQEGSIGAESMNFSTQYNEKNDLLPKDIKSLEGGDIAIIGLSGRFPKSPTLEIFWENLSNGVNCISEVPVSRWDFQRFYTEDRSEAGKHFSKWGGFVDDVEMFDPAFFNISPREAAFMDPQERLFLQYAWAAVEDAGYSLKDLENIQIDGRGPVGVYAGVMYAEYQLFAAEEAIKGNAISAGGSYASIANRVSYVMNLHGPSMTVDSMCSSSLTTLHLACQDLKIGKTDVAIAGGVNISIHPSKYRMLSTGQFISSRGHCESFGEGGEGYIPGEGVGVVLLKRLTDAERDGDSIYAVIKGSALSHGGKTNGYSVPNPKAQTIAIKAALNEACVDPNTVSYIEAHGTGTRLGDPIEITGLSNAFGTTMKNQFCRLGSVKSNIGHCESAAGIAGLTKVILQMKHGKIVPSLHSKKLNPNIHFENTPFIVNQELRDWDRPIIDGVTYPRIAGISAFGAGGSNAHVILEEYVEKNYLNPAMRAVSQVIVVLSAKSEERLKDYATSIHEFLQRECLSAQRKNSADINLVNFAYTLQVGRESLEERIGFIVGSFEELFAMLSDYLEGNKSVAGMLSGSIKSHGEALSVFSSDDTANILSKWFEQGRLHKIAEIWTKGLDVDWKQFYETDIPRRVHLPTYPFARERYWIEISDTKPTPSLEGFSVSEKSGDFTLKKPTDIKLIPLAKLSVTAPLNASFEKTAMKLKTPARENIASEKEISKKLSLGNIQQELVESLASALFMNPTDVDVDKQFMEMGLDSIIAVEWIRTVNKKFGTSIQVTRFYDYPTIVEFAKYLAAETTSSASFFTPEDNDHDNTTIAESASAEKKAYSSTEVTSQFEIAINEEQLEKAAVSEPTPQKIAIIGMSGRYPDAESLDQYWKNLTRAKNSIEEVPKDRWNVTEYYDSDPKKKGKVYCKWLGHLNNVEYFDPHFFGISEEEAIGMDPQHRLFLEEGYWAFENAGYSKDSLNNINCGVYLGLMSHEYSTLLIKGEANIAGTSNSYAIGAARLPYFLNLKGPAIPIDTACSSSLVATHLACQALKSHEIDMALVGGVTLYLTVGSYMGMCSAHMLSPEGQCKPFDDNANGFVPGEGVGAIILKRLDDAERDNDRVLGTIIASGINQDGKTNGLNAPSVSSQQSLIEKVYSRNNIDPKTISYIEAHGTGTRLGDPIELEALSGVFKKKTSEKNFCAIGSVKGNIGHTSAASGMASVHKVLLALEHKQIVPTINFDKPSSFFDFENSPFYVNIENRHWGAIGTQLRRAAVSSFGFSGTNAHIVIEEYDAGEKSDLLNREISSVVIALSAQTKKQLSRQVRELSDFLSETTIDMRSLSYTLQVGRVGLDQRIAFLADSQGELMELLNMINNNNEVKDRIFTGSAGSKSKHLLPHGKPFEKSEHLSAWRQGKNLERLADLWVQGELIEWSLLYAENKPKKISLPRSRFNRSRYWIGDGQSKFQKKAGHVDDLNDENQTNIIENSDSSEYLPCERIASDLVTIVAQYLNVEPNDIDTQKQFFDLGLNSIQLVKMTHYLKQEINQSIQPSILFDHKNIDDLSRFLVQNYGPSIDYKFWSKNLEASDFFTVIQNKKMKQALDAFPELIHLNLVDSGRPVFWIHGGMGGVQPYFQVADNINRPFFGIQAKGYQTDSEPEYGIDAMVEHYLSIIRAVQPFGPYDLGGYSFGGVLSYEITRRLQLQGQIVNSIFMVDSIAPDNSRQGKMSRKTALLQSANCILSQCERENSISLIHRDELHAELSDSEFTRRLAELMVQRGVQDAMLAICGDIEKFAAVQSAYGFEDFVLKPLDAPDRVNCIYVRNESGIFWGELEPYFYFESESLELDNTDYWSKWSDQIKKFYIIDVPSKNHMEMLSNIEVSSKVINICKRFYENESFLEKNLIDLETEILLTENCNGDLAYKQKENSNSPSNQFEGLVREN